MIQTYNAMLIERWRNKGSSEDVRWRSFLRWGTVKVKLLETNAPQKILMIRFETKTWLMENQVKLSCFSPVSVHLEIWLQLFWRLLDKNQRRFDSEAAAEAGRFYNYTNIYFWDIFELRNWKLQSCEESEVFWLCSEVLYCRSDSVFGWFGWCFPSSDVLLSLENSWVGL